MATIKRTFHVFMTERWRADFLSKEWGPEVWNVRVKEEPSRIYIGPQDLEIDIPDDFDPTAGQVAALNRQKADALEAYQRTVAEINERLSKLLALTNDVDAA